MTKDSLNFLGGASLCIGLVMFLFFFISAYHITSETTYVLGLATQGLIGVICVVLGSGALYKARSL